MYFYQIQCKVNKPPHKSSLRSFPRFPPFPTSKSFFPSLLSLRRLLHTRTCILILDDPNESGKPLDHVPSLLWQLREHSSFGKDSSLQYNSLFVW